MYLRNPGFVSLYNYIQGYESGLLFDGREEGVDPPFSQFNAFVLTVLDRAGERSTLTAGEHRVDLGSLHWSEAILEEAPDDQAAFELFFMLLHQFRELSSGAPGAASGA